MKNLLKYIALFIISCTLFSCSSEDELTEDWIETSGEGSELMTENSGTLDLSNYVAVGNSLTAGFADGALFPEGQKNSYPAILATQFEIAEGGKTFIYPDIVSGKGNNGSANATGRSSINLAVALAALSGTPGVSIGDAIQTSEASPITISSKTGANLNNFGVPGARVVDIISPGYGNFNPFFKAFQTNPTTSVIADAVSAQGSFFSLWIGSNDVLGYALAGGSAGEIFNPLDPSTITDANSFTTSLRHALDALSANGADGVILNVPPVTIIPFFQIVTNLSGGVQILPSNVIDAIAASLLNTSYGAYNAGLDVAVAGGLINSDEAEMRKIIFTANEQNAPVITDESLTNVPGLPSMRQAQVNAIGQSDLFPLTVLDSLGVQRVPGDLTTTLGISIPLPDRYSLTIDEQVQVITAYKIFNTIIDDEVAARDNLTLVDIRPLFADIFGLSPIQAMGLELGSAAVASADGVLGIEAGGVNLVPLSLSQAEIYNSVWSTDGVHPNARGAALVANEIIEVLNATHSATIQKVNPLDFAPINAPL